ncbi:MAG: Cof-type HAD-IIB family hydrolase [Spirochaetaceae bacterium]|nr:Cof-type HAD-IIB family hydrolase [Spirochaetaceae bacterium]
MDHTLLTEDGGLPPGFDERIVKLNALGIDFVAASGRPLYTLKTMFSGLKSGMGFISDNGASLVYKGEFLFKNILRPADYREAVRFITEESMGIPILCGQDCAFVPAERRAHTPFLSRFYAKMEFPQRLEEVDAPVHKVTVYFPDKTAETYYETLFKPRYSGEFSVTVGGAVWIDIMNSGVNKGNALRFLGKRLGLDADAMMAFGDTYNDIEMLEAVTHSYLVKNAGADMRQYASFTADSNDNFGVLKVIDQVIQSRS